MKNRYHVTFLLLYSMYFSSLPCFANQDTNKIDFKDTFYEEILKATVDEEYLTKAGKIPEHERVYQEKKINEEAMIAKRKYKDMMNIWHEPNLLPESYLEAALSILSHLELNEKKMLTFGTVTNFFGVPDMIYFTGYSSDETGTMASEERFSVCYKQKGVEFNFSVTGFCRAVVLSSSIINKDVKRWPQNYSYSRQKPILSNLKSNSSLCESLMTVINNIKNRKPSYYDWVSYMQRWPKNFKVPQAEYNLDIMMIDRVTNDLVIVYLKITGKKEILYCDTWWKLTEGKWVLLSDEQVVKYFGGVTKEN